MSIVLTTSEVPTTSEDEDQKSEGIQLGGEEASSPVVRSRKPLFSDYSIEDIILGVEKEGTDEEEDEESTDDEEEETVEDDDKESSDLDEVEEDVTSSLKACNVEYVNQLKRVLEKLKLELARNQRRQREIEEEISSQVAEEERLQQHRVRRLLKTFAAPYFKDKYDFQPPTNMDTLTRRFSQELPVWLPLHPKKFSQVDQARLKESVKKEAVLTRRSKLEQEITKLSLSTLDPGTETTPERLADLCQELRKVETSAEEVLLAARYESYDWVKISVQGFQGVHSPTACRLQWQNKLHPSINNMDFTAEYDEKLQGLAEFDCRDWDSIARRLKSGRTAIACFTRYKTHLNTVYNNRPWSKSEDERLVKLVEICRYSQLVPWQKVAFYMEDRTKEQCSSRFSFALRDNLRKGHFSEVEDLLLVVGIKLHGSDWTRISEIIPCRNSRQLHSRFNYFFKGEKAAWTKEEDEALLKEFKRLGRSDWSRISEELARRGVERNRGQCRRRIQNIWESFQRDPQ